MYPEKGSAAMMFPHNAVPYQPGIPINTSDGRCDYIADNVHTSKFTVELVFGADTVDSINVSAIENTTAHITNHRFIRKSNRFCGSLNNEFGDWKVLTADVGCKQTCAHQPKTHVTPAKEVTLSLGILGSSTSLSLILVHVQQLVVPDTY